MERPEIRLRATRALPPGLVMDDEERRATFSAALQQAEDLFAAARALGPFARPLPLFYSASQAGRAVAAAWSPDWRVFGHGLMEDRSAGDWRSGADVLRFRVKPHSESGIFGAVAASSGLHGLTGSVELGALWAALPGVATPAGWLRALPVWPQQYTQEKGFVLYLGSPHRGYVVLPEDVASDDPDAVDGLLSKYPAATGARLEVAQTITQGQATPWGWGVPLRWPAPAIEQSPEGPPPPELVASYVHERVPEYRYRREHWLIPVVGDKDDELSPLLIWWVLLFALSLLARYEPAAWRAALDPDRSELAVPLEQLLDEALVVVPELPVRGGHPGARTAGSHVRLDAFWSTLSRQDRRMSSRPRS